MPSQLIEPTYHCPDLNRPSSFPAQPVKPGWKAEQPALSVRSPHQTDPSKQRKHGRSFLPVSGGTGMSSVTTRAACSTIDMSAAQACGGSAFSTAVRILQWKGAGAHPIPALVLQSQFLQGPTPSHRRVSPCEMMLRLPDDAPPGCRQAAAAPLGGAPGAPTPMPGSPSVRP